MSVDRNRLEAVVTDVEGWMAQFPEIEQLLAERARYRAALEIVASRYWGDVAGFGKAGPYHIDPQKIARAALDGEPTDE